MKSRMRKKTLYISVMIAALILITFCTDHGEKAKEDSERKLIHSIILEICRFGDSIANLESVEFTDMKNGVIRRTYRMTRTYCIGPDVIEETHSYIKKCLQGQVYRKSKNDCRGTGTSADNWGAVKLQFCPTNDRACDMEKDYDNDGIKEWVADPTKSPAAKSCARDDTAGKNWKLADVYYQQFPDDISKMFPDLPIGSSNLIWDNETYGTSKSDTIYFNSKGKLVDSIDMNKDSTLYVICSTKLKE